MKFPWLRFFLGALVASFLMLDAAAQTQAGRIKVARVSGDVGKIAADGTRTPLKKDDELTQTDSVKSEKNGSAVLVFMNGSTIRVGSDTLLKVEEFLMDAPTQEIKVAELKAEPSVSKTKLNLAYGEIVGDVKTLNRAGGSTYDIKTPVGAAGIRGTTFRIVFRPTGDGKAFTFQLSTADGRVLFEGTTQGGSQGLEVPTDQEIVITGSIGADGVATFTMPTNTQNISPEATRQIQEAITQVEEVVKELNFTQTPPSESDSTPPPPPQEQTPELTPGSGRG